MPEPHQHPRIDLPYPLAAVAAWLLPGLAHWLMGERKRGLAVGAAILGLFLAGLLVGGIDVVDRRRNTLWYVGQALVGPMGVVAGEAHVYLDDHAPPQMDGPGRPEAGYTRSIGRVNELGTLYCTLAGVLNLFAILDAVGRTDEKDRGNRQSYPGA